MGKKKIISLKSRTEKMGEIIILYVDIWCRQYIGRLALVADSDAGEGNPLRARE